ncbi:MAG: 4Fe-4S binding protein [Candidatus Brocadiales bacterium]|nr:4Fe-4S binding protein [Candidatus Brocadiales bacterium]
MKYTSNWISKTIKITLYATFVLLSITTAIWASGGGRRGIGFFDVMLLPRVWVGALFCLIGMGLMMKSWVHRNLRSIILGAVFFMFGILPALPLGRFTWGMGMHPSPVCAITKPFLFLSAGREVPVIFITILAFIAVFSIIGNKLFCGWACPIGAIQELFNQVPLNKKFKIILPFKVTNPIRIMIFIIFITLILAAGIGVYGYFNPFHFLHWGFELYTIMVMLIVLTASLFIFRPFCYLICPVGLFTWILEHFSLVKVKVNSHNCKECNLCIKKSHCPAVSSIIEGKGSHPDCFACGRCISICPEKALRFVKRSTLAKPAEYV